MAISKIIYKDTEIVRVERVEIVVLEMNKQEAIDLKTVLNLIGGNHRIAENIRSVFFALGSNISHKSYSEIECNVYLKDNKYLQFDKKEIRYNL